MKFVTMDVGCIDSLIGELEEVLKECEEELPTFAHLNINGVLRSLRALRAEVK